MAWTANLVEDITKDHRAAKTEIKSFITIEFSSGCRIMSRVRCSKSGLNICVLSLTFIKREFWHTVGCDHVGNVQENGIQFMMWMPKYMVWIYNYLVIFTSIFCSFQFYKLLVPMLLAIFMMNMCNSLVHSVSGIYRSDIKWLRIETHFSDFIQSNCVRLKITPFDITDYNVCLMQKHFVFKFYSLQLSFN